MKNTFNRREFLATSTAATALTLAGLTAAARAAGANERLSVGIVGPGQRGPDLVDYVLEHSKEHPAELTAVCDIWSRNRERGVDNVKRKTGRAPRAFQRFEDMLAWDGLDAVIIATPDHAHARHLTMALKAGKHVYCEKPFANVLADANEAVDTWRASGKVATVGTQMRSDPRHIATAEAVRSGVIGPIVKVERFFSTYSPYRWRRANEIKLLKEQDTDWKAWLMGKPERPFDPRLYLEFRLFPEFSSGVIDQWMSHGIDAVHMVTGAKFPQSVVAHGGTYAWKDGRENGDTAHVLLDYPEGFLCSHTTTLANSFGTGGWIQGQAGTIEYGGSNWRISGDGVTNSKLEARPIKFKEGHRGDGNASLHIQNWLECVHKGQRQTNCTPEHGYYGAVACIMATQALHTGRRMLFDEKARVIREG
ncbi:MAG: Gfo/Idh/MocA family protein [Blastocatellia bacterium]